MGIKMLQNEGQVTRMNDKYIVMNFSNIYENQSFKNNENAEYIDVSDIIGTDCYCDDAASGDIRARIAKCPLETVHFIDSGNYHYMSKIWLEKADAPYTLVVFDNHPDMQPPAFGDILSCGGWIREVLKSDLAGKAVVIGVDGGLAAELTDSAAGSSSDFIQDNIAAGRIVFLTRQEIEAAAGSAGACSDTPADILDKFIKKHIGSGGNIYISIDKDVLEQNIVTTNWDQGIMRLDDICFCINAILKQNRLLGADICGEPSETEAAGGDVLMKSNAVNYYFLNILKNFFV